MMAVNVEKMPQLNGQVLKLESFVRKSQRWLVLLGERKMLFQATEMSLKSL